MPSSSDNERGDRRPVEAVSDAHGRENDRHVERLGGLGQQPGMELDQVGVRLRANDLDHLCLVIDQDQGAIVGGPDTQLVSVILSGSLGDIASLTLSSSVFRRSRWSDGCRRRTACCRSDRSGRAPSGQDGNLAAVDVVSLTGPDTRYGPFSLGVMLTSARVAPDEYQATEPTDPRETPWYCLEPERLPHQDRADPAGSDRAVDDEDVVHAARHAVGLASAAVLERKAVLVRCVAARWRHPRRSSARR